MQCSRLEKGEKERERKKSRVRKRRGEKVEGEMYTDLREIWDVTLIYSNLLSSKKQTKQNKRGER